MTLTDFKKNHNAKGHKGLPTGKSLGHFDELHHCVKQQQNLKT